MPADLGHRVLALLPDEPSMPVVGDSRDTVWTFLVEISWPLAPLGGRRQGWMAEHGVVPRPRGHRVLLPIATAGPGFRWVSEPAPGTLQLPSRTTVLDTVDLAIELTMEQACLAAASDFPGDRW